MKPQLKKFTQLLLEGNAHLFSMAGFRAEINKIKKNRECAFCPYPNFKFRDELSRKEYKISALCQHCQDEMFGKGGANEIQ